MFDDQRYNHKTNGSENYDSDNKDIIISNWYFGDVSIGSEMIINYIYKKFGNFTVKLIVND